MAKRFLITTEIAAHSPNKRASFGVFDQTVVVGAPRDAAKAAIAATRKRGARVSAMEAVRVRVSEQKSPGSTEIGKTLMLCDAQVIGQRTHRVARSGQRFARCEVLSKPFKAAIRGRKRK